MIELLHLPYNSPEDTSFICDSCFLPYSRHNFGGGSMSKSKEGHYLCDRYSQKKQMKAGTTKELLFIVEHGPSVMAINENHPLLGGEDATLNN